MTHNTLIVFEAMVSIFVPVFLLLILQGNLVSPVAPPDTVYYFSNLTKPISLPIRSTARYLIYDVSIETLGCFIGNIPQLSHCGLVSHCTGSQKIENNKGVFLLMPHFKQICTEYTGHLRFKDTRPKNDKW